MFQQTGPQGAFSAGVAREVPVLARADQRRPGRLGLPLQRRELHRRRRARAAARRPGVGRLLQAVRRASRARTRVHRGRGSARRHPGHAAQPRPLDAAVRRRPEHPRQASSRSAAIPTRSSASSDTSFDVSEFGTPPELWIPFQLDPAHAPTRATTSRSTGRLKPGVTRPAGAGAAVAVGRTSTSGSIPNVLQKDQGFSVELLQNEIVRDVQSTLLDPARRGQLRAAHRLRQRRQPAARARHGTPARDRDPRRDRRRPRAPHPAAADGERAAVARRRDHRARSSA